jgi:hypothetical protein
MDPVLRLAFGSSPDFSPFVLLLRKRFTFLARLRISRVSTVYAFASFTWLPLDLALAARSALILSGCERRSAAAGTRFPARFGFTTAAHCRWDAFRAAILLAIP